MAKLKDLKEVAAPTVQAENEAVTAAQKAAPFKKLADSLKSWHDSSYVHGIERRILAPASTPPKADQSSTQACLDAISDKVWQEMKDMEQSLRNPAPSPSELYTPSTAEDALERANQDNKQLNKLLIDSAGKTKPAYFSHTLLPVDRELQGKATISNKVNIAIPHTSNTPREFIVDAPLGTTALKLMDGVTISVNELNPPYDRYDSYTTTVTIDFDKADAAQVVGAIQKLGSRLKAQDNIANCGYMVKAMSYLKEAIDSSGADVQFNANQLSELIKGMSKGLEASIPGRKR